MSGTTSYSPTEYCRLNSFPELVGKSRPLGNSPPGLFSPHVRKDRKKVGQNFKFKAEDYYLMLRYWLNAFDCLEKQVPQYCISGVCYSCSLYMSSSSAHHYHLYLNDNFKTFISSQLTHLSVTDTHGWHSMLQGSYLNPGFRNGFLIPNGWLDYIKDENNTVFITVFLISWRATNSKAGNNISSTYQRRPYKSVFDY